MTENFCLPLTSTASIDEVGGKGLSLSRLRGAGFAVPDGFILSTAAYRRFMEVNALREHVLEAARPGVAQGMLSFEASSARIQALFENASVPAEVVEQLDCAYAAYGTDHAVAVRSSATAEDLPNASFAGQQDTYLNVTGIDALVTAVRNCWASLWTARAMSYRHQMGIDHLRIDHLRIAMAVVVQRMVVAEVSGITFTANPATGERGQLVVNASFGLGEAVVGGEVTPDTFVLDATTLTPTQTIVGTKECMTVVDGSQGTRLIDVDAARRNDHSLTPDVLTQLGSLCVDVERCFDDEPQDIEWLYAGAKLWLVQSRPITNLPAEPPGDVRWDPPEPGAYLSRSQLVEHIPAPVCSLFEDLHMRRSLQHYWGLNLCRRGNHEYTDTQPPACFVVNTTVNGYAFRHLGEPPRSATATPSKSPLRQPRWIARPLQLLRTYVGFVGLWRFVALPRYLRQVASWRALDPASASVEQLWAGIRAMSMAEAQYWYDNGVWNAFSLTRGTEFQLQNFLDEHAPGEFTSGQFLSGLRSPAFDAQNALAGIAEMIRADPVLHADVLATPPLRLLDMLAKHPQGAPIRAAIDAYRETHGHQVFTLDFVEPCEAERPETTAQSLMALVLQDQLDPAARHADVARRRATALGEALARFQGPLRRRFRWRLWVARRYYPNREEAMFHMGKAWQVLRPLAVELGRRLTQMGTLLAPEDIFFLTTAELGKAVRSLVAADILTRRGRTQDFPDGFGVPEYAELTERRRQLREARRHLSPPVHIPGPPPWEPAESTAQVEPDAGVLEGSAVSPGHVTAQACLILSPSQFHKMKPGQVLVCPTTTPAWTQLFAQASALVTDIGGVLAHGSIVAREYGIPAVLGIADATKRIEDGQVITVDGDRGTVTQVPPRSIV